MERKKENSRALGRLMPAICPAAMVDMERLVPGKTADKDLAQADPDGLAEGHFFDVKRRGFSEVRIDDPHDDAADQQR